MNAFEGVINDLNVADLEFIKEESKIVDRVWENANNYLKTLGDVVKLYRESGVLPDFDFRNWEEPQVITKEKTQKKKNSLKENIEPADENTLSIAKSRPKRNAFKEASQNINQQSNLSLASKLRRPENAVDGSLQNIYIKKEKISMNGTENTTFVANSTEVKVKTEAEEMPAPSRPAPRKRKQKKTTSSLVTIKQEPGDESKRSSDPDVVIEDVPITTVNLVDSDDDKPMEVASGRMTRTKTRQKKKRSRTPSGGKEDDEQSEKRPKANQEETTIEDQTPPTIDAQNKNNNDATFVANSPTNVMNTTVVVENPKYVAQTIPAELFTDDESEDEKLKTVTKKPLTKSKQIFSPFEASPVKKKIQAFEKLNDEINTLPLRSTRLKTKAAQVKEQESEEEPKSVVKEKAKIFTPQASKFIPKAASTCTKINKLNSTNNESLLSTKSASVLKATQAEYRERERKRREKEIEALKKREAQLQAQSEEKKRKREEKQLKAQQQREALEKEKLKVLEMQRLKDERHKKLIAEQEEKKQKLKEELEKKRLQAKMRAIEEKKKEEEKRLEEQKKADEMTAKLAKKDEEMAKSVEKQKIEKEHRQQLPAYMTSRAPLLPTDDCYDSDDENYRENLFKKPNWAQSSNLKAIQLCMKVLGESIKNSFFSRQAQTPDLQDIFEVIEARKLKRSSSAHWQKPPRYTMLMLPSVQEYNDTEEDD